MIAHSNNFSRQGVYADFALEYFKKGYCPIPIINQKDCRAPLIEEWQTLSMKQMTLKDVENYCRIYPNALISLVMGHEIGPHWKIAAIDIDKEDLVVDAQSAIGPFPCAKKGQKGLTVFCRVHKDTGLKAKKFFEKKEKGKIGSPGIEFLYEKNQTIVPPSLHYITREPYQWIGKSLLEIGPLDLPIITRATLDELKAITERDAQKIIDLNYMEWLGNGGGGNTHETCLRAAALMIQRGWTDEEAYSRIRRAKKEACERYGDEYFWPDEEKIITGWIQSAREKGFGPCVDPANENNSKNKDRPVECIIRDWAIEHCGGIENIVFHCGQLRRYTAGYWPAVEVPGLRKIIQGTFKNTKRRDIDEGIKQVTYMAYNKDFNPLITEESCDDPRLKKICLQNGTINLETNQLEENRRENYLLHRLPFDFEENPQCPNYEKFIWDTFSGDQESIDCIEEYMAYCLVPDNSFQKFLALKGGGGNGKGTLINLWKGLFDPDSIATVNVSKLKDEKQLTSLNGRLFNISSENTHLDRLSDSELKNIVGQDRVTIRYMRENAINNVYLYTRFLLMVNELPSTTDSSNAMRRRAIILECKNTQGIDNADILLPKKLAKERGALLRKRLIPAYQRLYKNMKFTIPKHSIERVNQWVTENDTVSYWLKECSKEEKDENFWAPIDDLFTHYVQFCKSSGFNYTLNKIKWGRKLSDMGIQDKVAKCSKTKKTVRYRNIALHEAQYEY